MIILVKAGVSRGVGPKKWFNVQSPLWGMQRWNGIEIISVSISQ